MIKKLKRKFIFIFMSITTLTLVGVLLFVGFSTKNSLEQDCRSALSRYLSAEHNPPGKIDNNSIILVLKYTPFGQQIDCIRNSETFPYSEEEVTDISNYCLEQKERYGILPDYPLAYMKLETEMETTFAFYDISKDRQTMQNLCISFCIGGVVAFFILYIISLFLSHWCIRPIEDTWKKQQDFIADASHELKTPLTVILANTALLNECSSSSIDSQKKCIEYIEEEAKHMSHLVNDMLFLAKTDALREDTPMESLDFSELCMNCYLPFEAVVFEKKISMNADICENICLTGSSDKLGQLINILLDNACKYTKENGSIHLNLSHKGNTAFLEICNTSEPISKDQLSHLFERFYRIDEARTRANGYGLGLSIAHSIVKLHHGKIKIDNSAEKGTTVLVELPM